MKSLKEEWKEAYSSVDPLNRSILIACIFFAVFVFALIVVSVLSG